MHKWQGGIQIEDRVELRQRFVRPLEPQQAQTQRIARAHVAGRHRDCPLQELLGFGHATLHLEIEGRHVEQQRMLQTVRQCRFGHDGSFRMRAALRGCVNCA
jgi:hypothetical protein